MESKDFKYGKPASPGIKSKPKIRLPQYDDALKEFLNSGCDSWEVNMSAFPSKEPRVILSSFKWRIKNKPEFNGIKAFMHKNKIYLEKIKT